MTVTEQYERICALLNCGNGLLTVYRNDGMILAELGSLDGQGDTIEDAFASLLMHAEQDALRRVAECEEGARSLRAKLSGERT